MRELRARIKANLATFERIAVDPSTHRRAAVAILLSPQDGKPTFVLTRRALTMRRGAGNYALPGGNCDAGEHIIDTALREVREELGIEITRDAALGMLDDFVTLGGHVVTPVILLTDTQLTLTPDPTEVHAAWFRPLSELDHPQAPRNVPNPDGGDPILRMFANGDWINPPTAAWLYQFREVALHGRPARLHRVGQPAWTAH
ncbi:MAG: CoA pyrophosphatase [Alphaproteobacteria bacterium]|nr:CoA pyrophosphatase [Alphaproteobacteria bacterium]MBV9420018.1 CoA pyrophosphatase [Alphaproteobacteria bacterium]